jgi:uncharacterized protein YdeI (YjbR/CyaY-like superfamily)
MPTPTKLKHFPDAQSFRAWLEKNHSVAKELWVGFHRLGTGKKSICMGWIDGVRKSIRPGVYTIRFTPRKAKSNWSIVNIRRVGELIKLQRMRPHGLRIFEARDAKRSERYSYERKTRKLSRAQEKRFKENPKAWEFFKTQAPWYQRVTTWWVVSAVKEETRERRLLQLIKDSSEGHRIHMVTNNKKNG